MAHVYEHKHWVGGGDLKQIRFGFDTVATGSGSNVEHIAVGQDLQIEKAVAIYNNTLVPMEFSGARSVVVPDGTYDYLSDSIDASAFGVSVLPHDAQITVRVLTRQTSAVSRVALSHKDARQFGGKSIWFNSSDTSLNDFETLSGFSVVGPTQTARTEIAIARLHGLSDAPDFVSIGVRGDSITQGTGDSGFSDREGGGWAFRAVQRFSKQPALMNYASHGSTSRMLIEDQSVISSYNLLTHAITAYGANNIGQSNSNPDAYLSLSQDTQTQLAQFKAAGLQAGVMHLIPRTSSTDLWRTEENQTINTGWGAGGAADNYNNDIANFSDADFVIEMSSIRGTERLKTVTNGEPRYATFDGTHPSAGGADLMSQDAAVVLNTEYGFELIS